MKGNLRFFFPILFLSLTLSTTAQNPQLVWAKQFGGTQNESGNSIAVDASGNVYTGGAFEGTVDFDPGTTSNILTSSGGVDAFITKMDATGNFLWAKRIGGANDETNFFLDMDSAGNIYAVGNFEGTVDFDPGSGVYNLTSADLDIFILKLDSSGSFVWAKQIQGPSIDQVFSIGVDNSGNVHALGTFEGTTDFDPSSNVFNLVSAGNSDMFICKLDASGNFTWAKQFEGPFIELGFSIAVDATGNVYSTGVFSGTVDFDPGTAAYSLSTSAPSDGDVFVSKLDASGSFVWAKQMGGATAAAVDLAIDIFVDASQNIYTTGYFTGTADFDPGSSTHTLTSSGMEDVFVSKLDPVGGFLWAKSFGGNGTDSGISISLNSSGNIYTTGTFVQTVDFDPGTGNQQLTSAGNSDIFISKLDNAGNFLSANQIGGTGIDGGGLIAIDGMNHVYLAGGFENTVDFDPASGTFDLTSEGMIDAFVLKLNDNLGIAENSFDHKIQLYPNPFSNVLNITSKTSEIDQIQVYDLLGRKVLEQKPEEMKVALDMEKVVPGMYVVKITSEGKTISHKIVKE